MAAAAPQRLEGLGLLVWVSGLNVLEPFVVAVQGHKDFRRSWAVSRCADSLPGRGAETSPAIPVLQSLSTEAPGPLRPIVL